jgi:NAD(P)H-hydrate epimerase
VIVQTAVPESIYLSYRSGDCLAKGFSEKRYDAVAIGPGLGTGNLSLQVLTDLLDNFNKPCVFDADALNIISEHRKMLSNLPRNSILTPHPKEFERLLGKSVQDSFAAMESAVEMAHKHHLIIVLKGRYTRIVTPDGSIYFNSTGNPGMATGGTGDVLTGMIGSLLAQGYEPEAAAKLGVFLHGMAADIALESESEESLTASDIVNYLGRVFKLCKCLPH